MKISDIDWARTETASGSGEKIPQLLADIRAADPDIQGSAYDELAWLITSDDTRSPAGVVVAPFLIEVVADDSVANRHHALSLLAGIAVGDEGTYLAADPDWPTLRAQAARFGSMSRAELDQYERGWINEAGSAQVRANREKSAAIYDVESSRQSFVEAVAAYDAVRAGLPTYLRCLRSAEAGDRLYAAALLAWFREDQSVILPALHELLRGQEPQPFVIADACIAAGLVGPGTGGAVGTTMRTLLDDPDDVVRATAAIGLARLQPDARHDGQIRAAIFECIANEEAPLELIPFSDGELGQLAAFATKGFGPATDAGIDILLRRLAAPEPPYDLGLLLETLIRATFPATVPVGRSQPPPFASFTSKQRQVARAIAQTRYLDDGPMGVRLYREEHNLPSDQTALDEWVRS
ncbi:hypothetical protein AB0J82_15365 [Asanoa sp. NPDC049518]|uniref:hypothetical protein n=1 Tax=unclassified Asanoa TaxID=2685164 RepID=UPI003418E7FA